MFEYSHCGENYTEAGADIVGAGEEATVRFEDFRDGALNNARLLTHRDQVKKVAVDTRSKVVQDKLH